MLTFHLLIYYILPQKHTEILVLVRLFYDDAFLNEVIEKDEIDRLFDKKVLTNVKRYGEKPTSIDNEIVSFGKEKDSLIIKGNNLYRVVFAVAKLTEGWDVLNLYDIVRIEQEAATNKNATMVEAQLIGRGARYYPFELDGVKSYQRRFDNDTSNKQLFLETLHYHTMNEPQYLKQLGKLSILPGIFNINEPMIFGAPIVMNPLLAVPFMLVPVVNTIIVYIFTALNIIPRMMVKPPFTVPAPLGALITTNWNWMACVLVFICFFVSLAIYYPFFKLFEKRTLDNENVQSVGE